MKAIKQWADLARFGIEPLTGEACGLHYRILCDITAPGKRILEKCLGLRDLGARLPWNQGSDSEPHIGSVPLVPELLIPLGVFALLELGCTAVWLFPNGNLVGIEPSDSPDRIEHVRLAARAVPVRIFSYQGTAGERNVHQMTQRIE